MLFLIQYVIKITNIWTCVLRESQKYYIQKIKMICIAYALENDRIKMGFLMLNTSNL